jgi:hypothetical protein
MRPKVPLSELEQLKLQVKWLEEQLQGHEDNFGKQIDKTIHLQDLLEKTQTEMASMQEKSMIEESRFASLANYLNAIEEAPLMKFMKAPYRREMREKAAISAFEAAAYKNIAMQLMQLFKIEMPVGAEHALVREAQEILFKGEETITQQRRKIAEAV